MPVRREKLDTVERKAKLFSWQIFSAAISSEYRLWINYIGSASSETFGSGTFKRSLDSCASW